MSEDAEDLRTYKVVVNHEDQYSLWPHDRDNPAGWRDAGKLGTRQDCLAFIREVWVDMRPLSLRQEMEAHATGMAAPALAPRGAAPGRRD